MSSTSQVEPFDYVIFGATGDLTMRKLIPAIYHRFREGQIPDNFRFIGTARSQLTHEEYRERASKALSDFVNRTYYDAKVAAKFIEHIFYASLNGAEESGSWQNLLDLFTPKDAEKVRVFYLATSPNLFGQICANLSKYKLVTDNTRVVLEKPIGYDLQTANEINESVGKYFKEDAIFRIDHYLGKETVQDLLGLRFANPFMENVWSAENIDYIQITAAETVGVEGRGPYYDKSGAMRDMIQNHLLQVMCMVAMEKPASLNANDLRNEKLKILNALVPITGQKVAENTVRAQYQRGFLEETTARSYLEDLGENQTSQTETYVTVKAEIDTPRWKGVPFYIRTGKRLHKKVSEIVIQFKESSTTLFPSKPGPDRLIIRLQPNEGLTLSIMAKDPTSDEVALRRANLDVSFTQEFNIRYPDAYERLMLDAVRGNPILFIRRDEVEAAWKWVEPILDGWSKNITPLAVYSAGSWGPEEAKIMLAKNGHIWHEDMR
ncbi:glucose-6-phosphate dehydrogenase [Entomobacter blattae]|uniref:glucose-6-phosphate dehydrogenase n=1 Tax=Entomobacter blattae TaxID=2762277 RepID=UPI0038D1F0A7